MRRARRDQSAGPMTLGNAAAAQVRLIVWCRACGHQAELDPALEAAACGADVPVPGVGRGAALLRLRRPGHRLRSQRFGPKRRVFP
jgi:hypothetical protein